MISAPMLRAADRSRTCKGCDGDHGGIHAAIDIGPKGLPPGRAASIPLCERCCRDLVIVLGLVLDWTRLEIQRAAKFPVRRRSKAAKR